MNSSLTTQFSAGFLLMLVGLLSTGALAEMALSIVGAFIPDMDG